MERYIVHIEGTTPLMEHKMTEDAIFGLLGTKEKQKKPKELLTPREIAERHVYKNNNQFVIPLEYIRSSFIIASADYRVSNTSRKSLKSVAAGAFHPEEMWAVLYDKKKKPLKDFEVDIRKGTNHQRGAVAICRPRFDEWRTEFSISLNETIITSETCLKILEDAGRRVGIGSFRISKGGFFGAFVVTLWKKIS